MRLEEDAHLAFRPGLYILNASGVQWSVLGGGGEVHGATEKTCKTYGSTVHGNLVAAQGMNSKLGKTSDQENQLCI